MPDPIGPAEPLSTLLRRVSTTIQTENDADTAFIVAGALNLYYEAIARQGTRTHLIPQDIHNLMTILSLLLSASDVEADIRQFVRTRDNGTVRTHD